MTRLVFLASLLGLLATATLPTSAHANHSSWPFWLSKPERHGSRKLAGDYTHHYGTYRNHSRQESSGLFGFLQGSRSGTARHKGPLHGHKSSRRRTSGIF